MHALWREPVSSLGWTPPPPHLFSRTFCGPHCGAAVGPKYNSGATVVRPSPHPTSHPVLGFATEEEGLSFLHMGFLDGRGGGEHGYQVEQPGKDFCGVPKRGGGGGGQNAVMWPM